MFNLIFHTFYPCSSKLFLRLFVYKLIYRDHSWVNPGLKNVSQSVWYRCIDVVASGAIASSRIRRRGSQSGNTLNLDRLICVRYLLFVLNLRVLYVLDCAAINTLSWQLYNDRRTLSPLTRRRSCGLMTTSPSPCQAWPQMDAVLSSMSRNYLAMMIFFIHCHCLCPERFCLV